MRINVFRSSKDGGVHGMGDGSNHFRRACFSLKTITRLTWHEATTPRKALLNEYKLIRSFYLLLKLFAPFDVSHYTWLISAKITINGHLNFHIPSLFATDYPLYGVYCKHSRNT